MPNIPLTPNESAIASDTLARLGVAWSLLTREKWDDSGSSIDDATLVRQSLPVPSRDSPAEITLMR